ncbi:AI-2E family transporter [Parvibaculum lavamentivorans]|uniref:AI-2E family transporter n=1 Tax=Parvibaculum lavamentivorans TaxID=256618 RepID=UPI0002F5D373|nr:AI-2E family transporter [Parvibaculum lavamentivorans]
MPETDAERGTEAAGGFTPGRRARIMRAETALAILAVLAILYTAYLAQNLVAPITAAVVGSFIFMPLMRAAPLRFLPDALSASIIVATLIGALAGSVYLLAEPAAEWTARIPAAIEEFEEKSRELSEPMAAMRRASKQVEEMTRADDAPREVVVRDEGLVAQAMEVAGQKGASILIFIVLLYFLLATGELLRDRIIRSAKRLTDKERARRILRSIEREISTYLFSISLINAGLGVAIGLSMWAIGLPNALLWGFAAALLNFIPYAGALAGMALTGFVAFMTFDSVGHALLAPAAYFLCNLIESQFVTPSVLGRRHTLNAAVVFISIVFWGWMWGVIGAVLAVPILVILNTCFAQVEGLRKFSLFIDGSAKPNGPTLPD